MEEFPFDDQMEESNGALRGAWRTPRQMLSAQTFGGHASIHDDATAKKFGFQRGTIEGPTHFSQFAPLCVAAWGTSWFETGCISAHYRNACFDGDRVRACMTGPSAGAKQTAVWMERDDGTEILRGTASVADGGPTELEQRLRKLDPLQGAVILRDVRIGMKSDRYSVRMAMDQHMGDAYPFSLADKLRSITEPSPWYTAEGAAGSPWKRPILPIEMISVLLNYNAGTRRFPVREPCLGLFADQELRLMRGPLFAGDTYELEKEIVGLSGSRRTESMWLLARVYAPGTDTLLATMTLNAAFLKDSYANYEAERAAGEAAGMGPK